MRVLGIDPGSRLAGYGCIDATTRAESITEAGVFRLGSSDIPLPKRLLALEKDLAETIERISPNLIAVESVFSHTSWPAAAITMAHARGVVLLAAQKSNAQLLELPPAEVKKALTGSGRATKDQVRRAVEQILKPASPLEPADVSDALAVALAAASRNKASATAAVHSSA